MDREKSEIVSRAKHEAAEALAEWDDEVRRDRFRSGVMKVLPSVVVGASLLASAWYLGTKIDHLADVTEQVHCENPAAAETVSVSGP